MIDLKERGSAKAGELWDVALEKRFFKHNLICTLRAEATFSRYELACEK